MARVKHRVGITASRHRIWEALTQPEGLSGWWSTSATVQANKFQLAFQDLTTLTFQVVKKEEDKLLHLKNIDGPHPWMNSHLEFHLEENEGQVFVFLIHHHPEATEEDFRFFTTKWPLFLVSLKSYLESGKGMPFPNDIKIQADL